MRAGHPGRLSQAVWSTVAFIVFSILIVVRNLRCHGQWIVYPTGYSRYNHVSFDLPLNVRQVFTLSSGAC